LKNSLSIEGNWPVLREPARLRASFTWNQAPDSRPRHAPMLSARKIQHQVGDHASIGKPVIAMHP
jgi:hypothetical protein